jgi:triacylglycerol esterase/lipase EstA (alpha/beta hydrolase family)
LKSKLIKDRKLEYIKRQTEAKKRKETLLKKFYRDKKFRLI